MSKMSEYDIQIRRLEQENQELRDHLKWLIDQVEWIDVDHDCKASPDSGCAWCFKFWQAETAVGIVRPEFERENKN